MTATTASLGLPGALCHFPAQAAGNRQNEGVTSTDPGVRRLHPSPDPAPMSDDDLLADYPVPDGRPLLRVNFVSSVDGSVTLNGRSGPLGDAADRRVFHLLRVACDAVLVGHSTVQIEQYGALRESERIRKMRLDHGRTADPVLVLVTRAFRLDPADPMFADAPQRPVIVTTEPRAHEHADRFSPVADVIGSGTDEVDLAAALTGLVERGLPHVLCEGGPHLLGSLVAADLVDELCLTLAPKFVGPGAGRIIAGPPTTVRELTLAQILAAGDELFLRYTRGV
jgi:riboflavin-specific deaminase-like protein